MREKNITIQKVEQLPVLASLLPYRFWNDTTFDSLETICEKCKKEIGPEHIRAEITETNRSVITIDAYGLCYDCLLITPVAPMRVRDDGSFLMQVKSGGWKEYRYAQEKTIGLLGQLITLFTGTGGKQ